MNYNKVIETLISQDAVKATEYISPRSIIRAVRKRYKRGTDKPKIVRNHNIEITLTIGKPNYREREFIKDCLKAKEPFPVKKIQIKL